MRTTAELREGFLSFFEEREHLRFPSFPLIPPPDDPSTLFISAGMQPLKPYFSGVKQPPAPRFTTAQKCLRAGGKDTDLDEVGLTARHASMFEMLGNFSFGDYFKDGAIDFAWEFVTEHMRLEPDRLWASVFAGDPGLGLGEDEVAVAGWLRKGHPARADRAVPALGELLGPGGRDRARAAPARSSTTTGAPSTAAARPTARRLRAVRPLPRVLEPRLHGVRPRPDRTLTPLPKQNIDTGLGLERGAMLVQEVQSVFDTDGFQLIMDWIAEESGVAYGDSPRRRRRTASCATTDAG